jgi:hypothetical protein
MTNCIFEPSIDTSSATICKWCGEEKILHNHNRQVPRLYTEEQMKQYAFECVANFLSNNANSIEQKLVEVIIDRNNEQFEVFKQPKK